jgi:hypothetical protein
VARNENAPATAGDGAGASRKAAYDGHFSTLTAFRAQALASRYALPIELAAMIAPLALGGANV